MNTIIPNTPINFCAHLISRSSVSYKNPDTNAFYLQPVSFVQYDKNNASDHETLLTLKKSWQDHDLYRRICATVHNIKNGYANSSKIYALTTQTDSFEKLNPDKILGITGIIENNPYDISLSDIIAKPEDRTHNKVGTTIINKLKDIYDEIDLFSKEGVEGFYIKNGFKRIYDRDRHYHWSRYPDGYI